jgi:hypothetical protein
MIAMFVSDRWEELKKSIHSLVRARSLARTIFFPVAPGDRNGVPHFQERIDRIHCRISSLTEQF